MFLSVASAKESDIFWFSSNWCSSECTWCHGSWAAGWSGTTTLQFRSIRNSLQLDFVQTAKKAAACMLKCAQQTDCAKKLKCGVALPSDNIVVEKVRGQDRVQTAHSARNVAQHGPKSPEMTGRTGERIPEMFQSGSLLFCDDPPPIV